MSRQKLKDKFMPLDIIELTDSSLFMTKSSGAVKFIYKDDELTPYEFRKGKFHSTLKKKEIIPSSYKNLNEKLFKKLDAKFN